MPPCAPFGRSFVAKGEVPSQMLARLDEILVRVQVHLLVFHRAPQTLDEDVVTAATLAVHADLDAVGP
jgi:hypothetical protein